MSSSLCQILIDVIKSAQEDLITYEEAVIICESEIKKHKEGQK